MVFDKNIFKAINLRSNYANIASLKYSNKDKFKDNNIIFNKPISRNKDKNQKNISSENRNFRNAVKSPFLKFPPKKEYTLVLDLDETLKNQYGNREIASPTWIGRIFRRSSKIL